MKHRRVAQSGERFSYTEEVVGSIPTLPMISRGGGRADAPHSNCGGPGVHVGSTPTLGMQICGDGSRVEPLRAREKMRVQIPLAAPDREGWLSLAKSTRLLSGRPQGHAGSNPAPSARAISDFRFQICDLDLVSNNRKS